jgi:hypothetical protein
MVVVPTFLGVTLPEASTVATVSSLEVQVTVAVLGVTSAVRVWAVVASLRVASSSVRLVTVADGLSETPK